MNINLSSDPEGRYPFGDSSVLEIAAKTAIVPSILDDATKIQEAFVSLTSEEEKASVLQQLIWHAEASAEWKKNFLKAIWHFPIHLLGECVEKHADILLTALRSLSFDDQKKCIAQFTQEKREWPFVFSFIFTHLSLEESTHEPGCRAAEAFASIALASLSHQNKKKWFESVAKEAPLNRIALLIVASQKLLEKEALLLAFSTRKKGALDEKNYAPLFTAFGEIAPYCQLEQLKTSIAYTVRKIFPSPVFAIANGIENLPLNGQIALLTSLPLDDLQSILTSFLEKPQLKARWLKECFARITTLTGREELTCCFLHNLTNGRLVDFVEHLAEVEFQGAVALFNRMPQSDFEFVIGHLNKNAIAALLKLQVFDATTGPLIRKMEFAKQEVLVRMAAIVSANSLMPLEGCTFERCFLVVQETALIFSDDRQFSDLIMQEIPPVLIGIACQNPDRKKALIPFVSLFTPMQMLYFACSMEEFDWPDFIQKAGDRLSQEQWSLFLNGLEFEQIKTFLESKSAWLDRQSALYNQAYRACFDRIQKSKPGNREDIRSNLTEWNRVWNELYGLAREPQTLVFYALDLHIKSLKTIEDDGLSLYCKENRSLLLEIGQRFCLKLNALKEKTAPFLSNQDPLSLAFKEIFQELERLENDEEDITQTLYEGFWVIFRNETLPYLRKNDPFSGLITDGINSLAQLPLIGIAHNEDLAHLGISQAWEQKLEASFNAFMMLSQAIREEERPEKQSQIQTNWKRLCQIQLENPSEILKIASSMVEWVKDLRACSIPWIENGKAFFESLLSFPHLLREERQALECILRQWAIENKEEMSADFFADALAKGLLALRQLYPLFCLQRYLFSNAHLRESWKNLNAHGIESIDALFKKGWTDDPLDLFCIEDLLTHLTRSEAPHS